MLKSTLLFFILSKSNEVTLNISPAPSASEDVIIGVWIFTNPLSLRNLWIEKITACLILNIALKVFVLGLRWATSLKNSKLCFFGWIGYFPTSDSPNKTSSVASNS